MPANLVWSAATGTVALGDLRVVPSSSVPDGQNAIAREAALPYLAPEQTGRTGQEADPRSDMYALGATFHFLLTGTPPFAMRDPMELIHAHLARQPRALHEIDAGIPPVLSSIVLKLLEKEPHRRYPSAEALIADLHEASEQWFRTGIVLPFQPGDRSTPRQWSIPDKLYGHIAEAATLREAFEHARDGQRGLILVAGAPGNGKSALVHELGTRAVLRGGHFSAGKFDQLERNIPYAGLVQAFRTLSVQLLTEPEAALAFWRERIQAAITLSRALVVDLIPELGDIVGPQQPVPVVGPVESKNRFVQVFTALLDAFSSPAQPLVLFLDDLQ